MMVITVVNKFELQAEDDQKSGTIMLNSNDR